MSRLHTPVAHRYQLDVPLRYRRAGEPGWHDGRTVNASRTGVLFQTTGQEYDAGTAIEIELDLPGPSRVALVRCSGCIVRSERTDPERLRMAATIDLYRFGSEGPSVGHSLRES